MLHLHLLDCLIIFCFGYNIPVRNKGVKTKVNQIRVQLICRLFQFFRYNLVQSLFVQNKVFIFQINPYHIKTMFILFHKFTSKNYFCSYLYMTKTRIYHAKKAKKFNRICKQQIRSAFVLSIMKINYLLLVIFGILHCLICSARFVSDTNDNEIGAVNHIFVSGYNCKSRCC